MGLLLFQEGESSVTETWPGSLARSLRSLHSLFSGGGVRSLKEKMISDCPLLLLSVEP